MLSTQLHVSHEDTPLVPSLFRPIQNYLHGVCKPLGGLWTSTYNQVHGSEWVDYATSIWGERPAWYAHLLTPDPTARIATIHTLDDVYALLERYEDKEMPDFLREMFVCFDFERMMQDYDALHLSRAGLFDTKRSWRPRFDAWDVESTCWFRWKFSDYHYLGPTTYQLEE